MVDYEVLFYETAEGRCPAREFLDGLAPKVRAKVAKWLELLEREGPRLPRPYADVVRGKIRELRVSFGGLHHRFLYFFHVARAQRLMADFEARVRRGEIRL